MRYVLLACTQAFLLLQAGSWLYAAWSPTPYPPDWPHRVPWKLSREILEADEVLFLVERLRGTDPRDEALDHLVEVASSHCRGAARWLWADDPTAPTFHWVDGPRLIEDDIGRELPLNQVELLDWAAQVATVSDDLAGLRVVFVRYVGMCSAYGFVFTRENAAGHNFPVIYLCQERIAQDMPPGFSRVYFEKRALVHEFGHVIGLGTNPAHGRWSSVMPYRGGAHCTNRECAVANPSAKALLRGQMLDFCQECRDDLEGARGHWREGLVFPEVPRLAQPDPAALVERLKKRNFTEGGEAEKLMHAGKVIVEPLLRRMESLPGGNSRSPRYIAERIVVQVLIEEDQKRRNAANSEALRYALPRGDIDVALSAWFEAEGESFLDGDEWRLPAFLVPLEASEIPEGAD